MIVVLFFFVKEKQENYITELGAQIRFVMLFSSSEIDLPSLEMWQIFRWILKFL